MTNDRATCQWVKNLTPLQDAFSLCGRLLGHFVRILSREWCSYLSHVHFEASQIIRNFLSFLYGSSLLPYVGFRLAEDTVFGLEVRDRWKNHSFIDLADIEGLSIRRICVMFHSRAISNQLLPAWLKVCHDGLLEVRDRATHDITLRVLRVVFCGSS